MFRETTFLLPIFSSSTLEWQLEESNKKAFELMVSTSTTSNMQMTSFFMQRTQDSKNMLKIVNEKGQKVNMEK